MGNETFYGDGLNKQVMDIQEPKPISSTFKAFKLDSWNSRVFKTHINPEVKILK